MTVPTGSFWLDEQLGGGWPEGQVSEIYGDPGAGTSTLALHALAGVTQIDMCVLFDGGHSFDYEYAAEIGVQLDQLVVGTDLSVVPYMNNGLALIVIDGPPIPPRLIPEGETVVLVGQGWPSRAATTKVRMRNAGIWRGGQTVGIEIVQNGDAEVPEERGTMFLHYGKGFSRVEEVLTLACERDIIDRRGSHYYLDMLHLASSWGELVQAVNEHQSILRDIEGMLLDSVT